MSAVWLALLGVDLIRRLNPWLDSIVTSYAHDCLVDGNSAQRLPLASTTVLTAFFGVLRVFAFWGLVAVGL